MRVWACPARSAIGHDGLRRLITLFGIALLATGVVAVTAQPALAACATDAHVYVAQLNGQSNFAVRFETDPLLGPVTNFSNVPVRPDRLLVVKIGGNGLKPNSFPTWSVNRPDGLLFSVTF
ncbi:hypothetical protein Rhe02_44030 [Rhizocola hellebori]|uniref:Uncharacterized protein n=1 Tax=Rhizocola hellebori TaxID=1392758 RepID=A0A8J3QB35_9ACTN|nr:hypothetical protein [Rhizocola hellebori]GIH06336.1 hypothetical protein Rhe02_44030 [Rhizocola hellebori]